MLSSAERPALRRQPQFAWPSLIECQVHPVKVAAVEALRWIGGPLSARELWLIGMGDPAYATVCHHVKFLLDLGFIELTHQRPRRGAMEKFYVLAPDRAA
jgi:hypothetical protein